MFGYDHMFCICNLDKCICSAPQHPCYKKPGNRTSQNQRKSINFYRQLFIIIDIFTVWNIGKSLKIGGKRKIFASVAKNSRHWQECLEFFLWLHPGTHTQVATLFFYNCFDLFWRTSLRKFLWCGEEIEVERGLPSAREWIIPIDTSDRSPRTDTSWQCPSCPTPTCLKVKGSHTPVS